MPLAARIGSTRWILSLAALTGTTALSIDMSLPAQPTFAREFAVSPDTAQLTLSLFLAAYAAGQIFFGYASDALGRRSVLVAGLLLFIVGAAASAASTGIATLLVARAVQGLGAAAAPVVARAMVRDTQPAADAARILSTIMAVLAVAPMLAPLAGGWLLMRHGWHAIFAAHVVIGVAFATMSALTLPETLPVERRAPFAPRKIAAAFQRFFRAKGTLLPTALVCLSFAGQFAFIADSPFVFMNGFGVSPAHYALYFGGISFALMAGAISGRRLLIRHPPSRVLTLGAILLCAGGLAVAAGVHMTELGTWGLAAPMVIYFVGLGLSGPSATAIAMDPVPEIAGTASAAIGCAQMLSGALSGFVSTRIGGNDPRTLGDIDAMVGLAAGSLMAWHAWAARRESRDAAASPAPSP